MTQCMKKFSKSVQTMLIALFTVGLAAYGQNRSDFFGNPVKDYSVCPGKSAAALTETQVENMIDAMLYRSIGIHNSYIIISCPQVENCQATIWTDGKPYILYNAVFLEKVKRLNFSEGNLPDFVLTDWETLTLLAHEIGHLVNNHFTNPKPGTRSWDWELEADRFAGFMIYMLKGKLADALSVYNSQLISDKGNYTHPGRADRKSAVEAGWRDAKEKHPDVSQTQLNNKDRYDLYILSGDKLYDDDEFEKAIEEYNKAISLDPNKVEGYYGRGWAYYEKNDYLAAIADFDKAVYLDPSNYSAYRGRAIAKTKMSNYSGAMADYNTLIKLKPQANYFSQRAAFRSKYLEDHNGALADYDEAIRLNPNSGVYYYNRGWLILDKFYGKKDPCPDFKKGMELKHSASENIYKDYCVNRNMGPGWRPVRKE